MKVCLYVVTALAVLTPICVVLYRLLPRRNKPRSSAEVQADDFAKRLICGVMKRYPNAWSMAEQRRIYAELYSIIDTAKKKKKRKESS